MKTRIVLLFLLAIGNAAAQYGYDYADNLHGINYSAWAPSGDICPGCDYYPGTSFPGIGGSLIYTPAVSTEAGGNPNDYEILTEPWVYSGQGGTLINFVRASSYARPGSGSYVSVEFVIPESTGFAAPVQLNVNQCVNGVITQLGSNTVSLADFAKIRTIVFGTNLWVFINNLLVWQGTVTLTTGQPGVGGIGMDPGLYFVLAEIGHHDTVAPTPVNTQTVASYLLPNSVSMQWNATADDSAGIGVMGYEVSRNGTSLGFGYGPDFTDSSAQPSTTYTYQISATDYHGNTTPSTITITTPPAQAIDSRRVGLRPTGSYWGGGGEQIDTLSGNLNFSIPLIKPQGRTGWSVPIGLSYNSQNWRRDSGGVDWKLGADVGYGYGWKLLIGSVTPFYSGTWSLVDHYVYTDSSGAEYRLDVNNNGVWSSTQSVYVWFDSNANELYFSDGTFWNMGCTSGGTEPDAGTMYPTIITGRDGSQIRILYYGTAPYPQIYNASARILNIQDARGPYGFSFNTDSPVPHITQIGNGIGTAENYSFTWQGGSFSPPFGTDAAYAGETATYLASITVPVTSTPYAFTYDTTNSGELSEVSFPYGGHVRWGYQSFSFADGTTWREVNQRYVAADSGGLTEWPYTITRSDYTNPPAAPATIHSDMTVVDASGIGAKTWTFSTQASGVPAWQVGLSAQFNELSASGGPVLRSSAFTWSRNASNNPYISSSLTTSDPGTPNQQIARADQTQDQYGNVTQSIKYAYNNTTTPLQTYNSTFQNGSTYIAAHVVNLPLSTTLTFNDPTTNNPVTKTLVTNYYDGACPSNTRGLQCPGVGSFVVPSGITGLAGLLLGALTFKTTPAIAASSIYWNSGGVNQIIQSDGKTGSMSADQATNYAAPMSLATESYSASLAYSPWLGVTQSVGANGETSSLTYDSNGRPSTSISPYGARSTYTYSPLLPATQNAQTMAYNNLRVLTAAGPYTTTTLDGFGRTIRIETGTFTSGATPLSWADTVYAPCACSPLGKVQKVSQPYAPGGTPSWTVYTYDGLGRAVGVQQPDGASAATYSYSGNQTTVTDPAGKWKKFTKDVFGNLTSVVEPDPSSTTGGTLTTSYTYDWMNHVSQVSMTRAGTTQNRYFVYNDAGFLTSSTTPENGTVTYTYNADNTLQDKLDAKGQDTIYSYDNQKRVKMMQRYPQGKANAEDVCQRVVYAYDHNYYPIGWPSGFSSFSAWSQGRLAARQWGSSTIACIPNSPPTSYAELFNYTQPGDLSSKELLVTRNGMTGALTASYAFSQTGKVASVTYPSWNSSSPIQPVYTYAFDTADRPVSVTDDSSVGWVQNVQYDFANRVTGLSFAVATATNNGTTTATMQSETRTYDPAMGQLNSIAWAGVGSLTYSFPAAGSNNGQIQQMADSVSHETIEYQYDSLKRMTSAISTPMTGSSTAPWNEQFQYDGFGNLVSKTLNNGGNLAPAVNPATNQLSCTLCYDLNGNMISGVGATLGYDVSNRMTSAQLSGGGVEYYGYGPDNKRIYHQYNGGAEEWILYGAHGEQIGKYALSASTGQFSPTLLNVWFGGRLVATQSVSGVNTRTTNPVLPDRLGTNRAVGARFYAYGDEITSPPTSNDREKFGTYTRDSYTGLDYADQRFYASTYGRFNTPDPYTGSARVGLPGSWNRYLYVADDPINSTDASGLDGDGSSFDGITLSECQNYDINNECEWLANEFNLDGGGGSAVGAPVYDSDASFSVDGTASTAPDPGPDVDDSGSDTVDAGNPEPAPPAPVSVSSCVAGSAALGSVIGAGILGPLLGGIGAVAGGVGGTFIEPVGGTIAVGVVGGELGATGGTLLGTAIGGGVGGRLGNIFCSSQSGPRKGERRKAGRPDGTPNPAKHAKPDPLHPGRWLVKDPHTGKWNPKPPGWKP